jgi:hypothetical protein
MSIVFRAAKTYDAANELECLRFRPVADSAEPVIEYRYGNGSVGGELFLKAKGLIFRFCAKVGACKVKRSAI